MRHEEIPGYMDAMTMPFSVAEPKMLAELRPGDEIEAKLVVGEKSSRLEGIVVSRHGTAPAVQTIPEQGPYGRPGRRGAARRSSSGRTESRSRSRTTGARRSR